MFSKPKRTRRQRTLSAHRLRLESLEARRVLTALDLDLPVADGQPDQVRLLSDGGNVAIEINDQPTMTVDDLSSVTVNGTTDALTVIVDWSNGAFDPFDIIMNGGSNSDEFRAESLTIANLSVQHDGQSEQLTFEGFSVNLNGVEESHIDGDIATAEFGTTAVQNPLLTLQDDGMVNGKSVVEFAIGKRIVFDHPGTSLTLSGSEQADYLQVRDLEDSFAADISVNGNGGGDGFALTPAGGVITVVGGDPSTEPGDALRLIPNGSEITTLQVGQTAGSGSYSTTGGLQDINFSGVELLGGSFEVGGSTFNDRFVVNGFTLEISSTDSAGGMVAPARQFGLANLGRLTIQGGPGDDVFEINNPNDGIVAGEFVYDGGPGFDGVSTLGGGGAMFEQVYSVGPTNDAGIIRTSNGSVTQQITFTGLEPFTTTTVSSLVVNATDGANNINVVNGAGSLVRVEIDAFEPVEFENKTSLTLNAGDGVAGGDAADTITINYTNMPAMLTDVIINGDEGFDTIQVTDANASGTITINGDAGDDQITVSDANANQLTVNGGLGSDMIQLTDSNVTGTTTLNGDSNADTITVTDAHGTELIVNGGASDDTIQLDDTSTTGTTHLQGDLGADMITINDAHSDRLLVDENSGTLGSGNDTIVLNDTNTVNDTTLDSVDGGGSVDSFTINDAHSDTLTIRGRGGADIFTIFDTSTTGVTEVFGDASAEQITLHDANSGSVTINSGSSADTVTVIGTQTVVSILGDTENDTINVGGLAGSGDLSNILALVTVDGNDNVDTLNINDDTAAAGHSYRFDGGDFFRNATQLVDFQNVERVNLNLGNFDDTVQIDDTDPGVLLTVNAAAGNDTFNVRGVQGTTTLNGGDNDDTFNVSSDAPANTGDLAGIQANVTLAGDGGTNTAVVSDAGNGGNVNGALTLDRVNGLGMGGVVLYSGLADLQVDLGGGVNNFTINSTHAAPTLVNAGAGDDRVNVRATTGPTTVNGNDGSDRFEVGSSGLISGIAGALTVNGDAHDAGPMTTLTIKGTSNSQVTGDELNIRDQNAVAGGNYSLDTASIMKAGANITYATIESVGLFTGMGADTVDVIDTLANSNTRILTGDGSDTVNVASTGAQSNLSVFTEVANDAVDIAAVGMDSFVIVDGGTEDDAILVQSTTSGSHVEFRGQAGNDLGDVLTTATGSFVNLRGGDQDDSFLVGQFLAGDLAQIEGLVCVDGGTGMDDLTLDDVGATGAHNLRIDGGDIFLDAFQFIDYQTTESLSLFAGDFDDTVTINDTLLGSDVSVSGGFGNDTFNVQNTNSVVAIFGDDGDDTFNVSSDAPANTGLLDGIQEDLIVDGGGDTNVLNVSDSGDNTPNFGILTNNTLLDLGLGGTLGYTNFATLNLDLGSEADDFFIESTHTGVTNLNSHAGDDSISIETTDGVTNVSSGAGSDFINITQAFVIDGIQGEINIDGGAHDNLVQNIMTIKGDINILDAGDEVVIDDSFATLGGIYDIDPTSVIKSGVADINYFNVETLTLYAGDGSDILDVNGTADNTDTTVRGGLGTDLITVYSTGAGSNLAGFGEFGVDLINMYDSGDGSYVSLSGGDDGDTLSAWGTGTAGAHTLFEGDAGDDSIFIRDVAANSVMDAFGNTGNDFIAVEGSIDTILSTVCIHGNEDDDFLRFSDIVDTDDNDYYIDGANINRNGGLVEVVYDTIEELEVFAGNGNDQLAIFIDDNADGLLATASFFGNGGDDVFNAPTGPANPLPNTNPRGKLEPSMVTELNLSGAGPFTPLNPTMPADGQTDEINLDLTDAVAPVIIDTVNGTTITASHLPINFAGMEEICLDDASGDDLPIQIGDLYVKATEMADVIIFTQAFNGGIIARINDVFFGPFPVTGEIITYARGGDDEVIVAGHVPHGSELHGEDGADYIAGGSQNDTLLGGAGNDRLTAMEGDNIVLGGTGNDRMEARSGNDTLEGGIGNDTLFGSSGSDTLDGGIGNDDVAGGNDDDLVYGGPGNDVVDGEYGDDIVIGGDGNDRVIGHGNDDLLIGGDGVDELFGMVGDDLMIGGITNFDDRTDANILALRDILALWTVNAVSIDQRRSDITTGNGVPALNAGSITDDFGLRDSLYGSSAGDLALLNATDDFVDFLATADRVFSL